MESQTVPTLRLSDDSKQALYEELSTLDAPERDSDYTVAFAHKAFSRLPVEELRTLFDFGRHVAAPPAMLVENLPVDPELPPTPIDGGPASDKNSFVSEGVLLGLSSFLGEPVAFRTEKDGRLIHDIVPTADGALSQTSQASKVFLNFHNDIVHDDGGRYDVSNPDFLVLNCLRGPLTGSARTFYCSALGAVEQLPESIARTLRKPLFRLNAPGGYTRMYANGEEVWSQPVPLIVGPGDSPEIFLAANGVRAETAEAEDALAMLQEVCRTGGATTSVDLKPGCALLVNNRKGVHARERFTAAFDGADRWLQRTYVRRSLWNIRDKAVDPRAPRLHR